MSKKICVDKAHRRLTLYENDRLLFACPVALSLCPTQKKQKEGDLKTPEGTYFCCLKKGKGKFGPSLGVSYPNVQDAQNGIEHHILDESLLPLFEQSEAQKTRPPWGTPLGGEIFIHGCGAQKDWTKGCIALNDTDMCALYLLTPLQCEIVIF